VVHAAHQGNPVRHAGHVRQQFGHADVGSARRDRLEIAADGVGRVRLGIEGVNVAGTAELVQEDDRFRARLAVADQFWQAVEVVAGFMALPSR
jgi:hypothetical protein